ncbi:uncharacterized protein LOC106063324 [Biomphalaria glabrata]|uniref:type I protein arginine methyltransferase n=1 Tax=Biomphalaria glabrata TaxID=6526 RepID=A0A9U8E912_BIOGL|nr:uncharacterized protein LOC106063324 [Biomphalaria glabrata]XP_013077112.2 uncharacterized protein LOC106063324 [Biomphalaria glabrata]XP_055871289.1 uncharacterized protein LOC106063324 [Biomphalaria glabrata]XP_055871290.1 uncharacterized protein LOC106063324 [Biomphalaria glabrata]
MADASPDSYFNSYADLGVHALMIKDWPRTATYRNFFENNRDFVKGKVVLDVGAGTGILSLFAATAGARKVYAVEASSVACLCQEIVEENHLENIIEVIHGAVEDISLPEKVDIIVSEWMGFYLLHESMLDSVIIARDKFLAQDGVMAPSHATLYLAPVDMSDHFQERAEEWSNIFGYDLSPLASQLNIADVSKPLIKCIKSESVKAESQTVFTLDLKRVTVDDVRSFTSSLLFSVKQDSKIFGFAAWFDVYFYIEGNKCKEMTSTAMNRESLEKNTGDSNTDNLSPSSKNNKLTEKPSTSKDSPTVNNNSKTFQELLQLNPAQILSLKTGPQDPPTHWKQTIIILPQAILVEGGTEVYCRLSMAQSPENKRHYNITLKLDDDSNEEDSCEEFEDSSYCANTFDFEEPTDHPVPCCCGSDRCVLISTLIKKMDDEEKLMQDEVDSIQQEVQVETHQQLNAEITKDWQLDSSKSSQSLEDDSNLIEDGLPPS